MFLPNNYIFKLLFDAMATCGSVWTIMKEYGLWLVVQCKNNHWVISLFIKQAKQNITGFVCSSKSPSIRVGISFFIFAGTKFISVAYSFLAIFFTSFQANHTQTNSQDIIINNQALQTDRVLLINEDKLN